MTDYGPNYLIYEDNGSRFHYTRKGDAIYYHIDSKNPRGFSVSAEKFNKWAFNEFGWCKMLLITTERRSIKKIAKRLGFLPVAQRDEIVAMMRLRDG